MDIPKYMVIFFLGLTVRTCFLQNQRDAIWVLRRVLVKRMSCPPRKIGTNGVGKIRVRDAGKQIKSGRICFLSVRLYEEMIYLSHFFSYVAFVLAMIFI